MNFKAVDGNYYVNPVWEGPRYAIKVTDDYLTLYYVGKPTWAWARRVLPKLGIRAKLAAGAEGIEETILGGKLVEVTSFRLWPMKPISVPDSFDFVYKAAETGAPTETWNYLNVKST